jgi:hypothetical protein
MFLINQDFVVIQRIVLIEWRLGGDFCHAGLCGKTPK